MAAATAFVAANIWTGCPLLAVWIGSRMVGRQGLSMAAVGVVVVVLAVLVFAMAVLLTWLNNIYDELTGRQRTERRTAWLRSMRAESERHVSQKVGVTALERIVMVNVYVAVIALVVWYVAYAAPPAPTLCTLHC
jgi:TM2 domain-containing membrane protein YozV